MKLIKKNILIAIICVSIPIGIFAGVFGYYTINNYLEDYYCLKSGGIGYDEHLNGCAYAIIMDGQKMPWIPGKTLTMGEIAAIGQRAFEYVDDNVNHGFTEREYSAVMRLANDDLDRAIEIFNDPEYLEKFYGDDGTLP